MFPPQISLIIVSGKCFLTITPVKVGPVLDFSSSCTSLIYHSIYLTLHWKCNRNPLISHYVHCLHTHLNYHCLWLDSFLSGPPATSFTSSHHSSPSDSIKNTLVVSISFNIKMLKVANMALRDPIFPLLPTHIIFLSFFFLWMLPFGIIPLTLLPMFLELDTVPSFGPSYLLF